MSPLPQSRLDAELSLAPAPLVELGEDSRWLHIGTVRLSKRYPRISIGSPHPIVAATRFELQRFESNDLRGTAIVMSAAGTLPDYFAGWVPESEHEKAARWVERLNVEIGERLATAQQYIAAGKVAEALIYQQGSEHAPDSPWGGETLELSRRGELEYEQRRSGRIMRTAVGRVDPTMVLRLHTVLADTSFPSPPQKFFPPGASVCLLITDPPFRKMPLDLYSGLKLQGYDEVLRTLSGLCLALRESNTDELSRWNYIADGLT